jgi:hypothetical protein
MKEEILMAKPVSQRHILRLWSMPQEMILVPSMLKSALSTSSLYTTARLGLTRDDQQEMEQRFKFCKVPVRYPQSRHKISPIFTRGERAGTK